MIYAVARIVTDLTVYTNVNEKKKEGVVDSKIDVLSTSKSSGSVHYKGVRL